MTYARAAACAAALYATWFVFVVRPAARSHKLWGPRWLATAASGVLYRFGCWYLNFSVDTDDAIRNKVFDPSKQYFMVWHPHGAFSIAALYFFGFFSASSCVFTDNKLFCGVADLLLRIPGLAEYLLLVNARSVDSKTLTGLLTKGITVGVQPGGIYEQVHTDHRKEVVYFPARLGFIRMAIKQGLPLLPAYVFGENQLYDTSNWLRGVNKWLYRSFQCGNLFVHGRSGGLPVTPIVPNPLLLPNPGRGLHFRWGEPVEVGPADPDPSDEKVHEVYVRYTVALQRLFEKHKNACLPPEVAQQGLEIVRRQ